MKIIEIKTIEEIDKKIGMTYYSNPNDMGLLLIKTRKNAYLFMKLGSTFYHITCTIEQYESKFTEKDFNWFRNQLDDSFHMDSIKTKICDEILEDSGLNFNFLKPKNK